MEFSENLKNLRKSTECTQRKLASQLGLSANTVCEWEKGRSEPSIASIIKMADFFDVSVDYLLGLEDDFGARVVAPMHDNASLTEKEKALLKAFRNLLPETQDFVLRTVQLSETDGAKTLKKN